MHVGAGRAAGGVGAQEDLVLGGSALPPLLLLGQELLEARGGEGERLSAQAHQVGVLQPRVAEAVFDSRPGPGGGHGFTL